MSAADSAVPAPVPHGTLISAFLSALPAKGLRRTVSIIRSNAALMRAAVMGGVFLFHAPCTGADSTTMEFELGLIDAVPKEMKNGGDPFASIDLMDVAAEIPPTLESNIAAWCQHLGRRLKQLSRKRSLRIATVLPAGDWMRRYSKQPIQQVYGRLLNDRQFKEAIAKMSCHDAIQVVRENLRYDRIDSGATILLYERGLDSILPREVTFISVAEFFKAPKLTEGARDALIRALRAIPADVPKNLPLDVHALWFKLNKTLQLKMPKVRLVFVTQLHPFAATDAFLHESFQRFSNAPADGEFYNCGDLLIDVAKTSGLSIVLRDGLIGLSNCVQ